MRIDSRRGRISAARTIGRQSGKALLVLLIPWLGACQAPRSEFVFKTGNPERIAGPAWRKAHQLEWFPDGNLGVSRETGKTLVYAANGPRPVRLTLGKNFQLEKVEPVVIEDSPSSFNYLAGGPIYRDPHSGKLLLFYHAEIHHGSPKNFHSVLGLAVQVDDSALRFRDAGLIFTPHLNADQIRHSIEVGGAAVVVNGGYFYVYARDVAENSTICHLAVARARADEVLAAAAAGKTADWRKYHHGHFSEPAIGGRSSPLEIGNPENRWMDLTYNQTFNIYVLITAAKAGPGVGLYAATSKDGINWSRRVKLKNQGRAEFFYPSIDNSAIRKTNGDFFLYYTRSLAGGWARWKDAQWERVPVTINRRSCSKPQPFDWKNPK